MTRFLSFLILSLHVLSDLKRSITLPATAALLTAAATCIVATTVAADTATTAPAAAARLYVPARVTAHLRPAEVFSPLIHRRPSTVSSPAAEERAGGPSVPPPAAGAVPGSATHLPAMADATANSPASAGLHAAPLAPTPPVGTALQLAAAVTACRQGQMSVDIATARITLPSPLPGDTPIVWYWETHTDGATAAAPPVPADPASQTAAAGATSITLPALDAARPLLSAPEAAYAYSVRLHATAPFELVSEWISVPQSAGACQP